MSIFVLLEFPLEVIMSGHIKWNRVSRGVIISMLLLITMGCGHNMRIENSVEQNTVEIQKVEDHAGTIVLPEAVLLILLLWRSRQDGRENMRSS